MDLLFSLLEIFYHQVVTCLYYHETIQLSTLIKYFMCDDAVLFLCGYHKSQTLADR